MACPNCYQVEDRALRFSFVPIKGVRYRNNYVLACEDMNALLEAKDVEGLVRKMRILAEDDLFFMLYFILDCQFLNTAFHVPRIAEVQAQNHRTLDLWAREHGKSTILTYGLLVWMILRDPEITIGIFSHTRAIAKAFLNRIKTAFEKNSKIKMIWPHIIPENPEVNAPLWSVNEGITVMRTTVVPEATIEAWGMDKLPTSKHFKVLHYDDIENEASVTTQEQIDKTREGFRMSLNLGRSDGITRIIGTIYHYYGLMQKLKESKEWNVRFYPGEDEEGKPVYWSSAVIAQKKKDMGPYVYSTQILLTPVAKENQKFQQGWLSYYRGVPTLNKYIIVDPAKAKSKRADSTTMWVIGVDEFKNRFVLDCVRDKLNLKERWTVLVGLVRKWKPMDVGYEQYALMSDVEYYKEKMLDTGVFFNISELGGRTSKEDRILSLVPLFIEKKIKFPAYIGYKDVFGETHDLVQEFIMQEYLKFPYVEHDDMLDSLARINDMKLVFPGGVEPKIATRKPTFDPLEDDNRGGSSWMQM